MAAEVSTSQLLHGYSRFFHRYHFVLFVVTALGGLAIVVFLLNQTIQTSTDTTANAEAIQQSVNFDQATIKQLEELKQTGSSDPLKFPNRRINPFIE